MAKPTEAAWKKFTGVRRVTAEFRAFQNVVNDSRSPKLSNLTAVNDNVSCWRFHVKDFDEDVPAGKQLNQDLRELGRKHGQDYLLMEATFPADYPTNPFFLRVVSPRCIMYTGHVTAGGSICIEALVPTGGPGGWRPDYCVEGILVLVFANMLHAERTIVRTATGPGGASGPLRVDLSRRLAEYSMAEAKAAYGRTVSNRGWSAQGGGVAGASGSSVTTANLPLLGAAGPLGAAGMATAGILPPSAGAQILQSSATSAATAAAAAVPLPAAAGLSPAHRTRARTTAAAQPYGQGGLPGGGATGSKASPLAVWMSAAAAAAATAALPSAAAVAAPRPIAVIATGASSAAAAAGPIAAAAAPGQATTATSEAAAGSGPAAKPEVIVLDDDDDDDDHAGSDPRSQAATGRRKPAHPHRAVARKRNLTAVDIDDDDNVIIVHSVDRAGGPSAGAGAPSAQQGPRASRNRRQDGGNNGAAGGGRGATFADAANVMAGAPNGRPKQLQGAAKAPEPASAAAGQSQQRGAGFSEAAGGDVEMMDLTGPPVSRVCVQMASMHLSPTRSGRTAALTLAAGASGPAAKKRQRTGAVASSAAAASLAGSATAVAALGTAAGVAAATAAAGVVASGSNGAEIDVDAIAAAAAAEFQRANDAALAEVLAQLEEAKAMLDQEKRDKLKLQEKMQDLAAQALLARGTGGAVGSAGASTSAAGTSKAPAAAGGDLLLSAPPPAHWEPLRKEEGFGVKMVVLPLQGDALAVTNYMATPGSGSMAAPAPLNPFDIRALMENRLDKTDATDLLRHCNGNLDEALELAWKAADCGGIVELLKRLRQAAGASAADPAGHAAARAAAQQAELERVLARFKRASGLLRSRIVRVERVQNWRLWTKYQLRRSEIEARAVANAAGAFTPNGLVRGQGVNEYLMWHGTSEKVVELVLKDGFDSRESSRAGALGEGIYFAANANYSIAYCAARRAGPLTQPAQMAAMAAMPPAGMPGMSMMATMPGMNVVVGMHGMHGMPGMNMAPAPGAGTSGASSSTAFPGKGGAMMLCRVALGTMAIGSSGIRKPPFGADSVYMSNTLKASAASSSVARHAPWQQQQQPTGAAGAVDPAWDVGSAMGDNLIVAVFDNAQAYPEYVVHFN